MSEDNIVRTHAFPKKTLYILFILCFLGISIQGFAKDAQNPANSPPSVEIQVAEANPNSGDANVLPTLTDLSTRSENGGVTVSIKSTQPLNYTAFKLVNPLRLVLDFPGAVQGSIPNVTEVNKEDVTAIRVIYFEEAQVLRLEIGLSSAVSYEILKPGTNVLEVQLISASTKSDNSSQVSENTGNSEVGGVESSIYTEGVGKGRTDTCAEILGGDKEPINLDFQNANIKNIFRIISEVSGFNVVLSPDVTGAANIRLIDVPWNTALELILENNALGRVCELNVIRIAPKATLMADQETEALVTEMIRINYADINDMVTNLKGLASQDRGNITADVRTNTLILTDIQVKVDEMTSVIRTLDVQTPQVMIESKIIEIRRNFAQELGINWGVFARKKTFKADSFPSIISFGGSRNTRGQLDPAVTGEVINDFIVDLGVPSGVPAGSFGVSLLTSNGDHALDIQIEALEEQGKSRTVANPKVTTLDNKEALIKSGQQIPYQTTSANEGTKIAWVDADLRLTVTPHITAEEDIYMKIEAKQNQADFDNPVLGVPTIITKEAQTEVLVDNGSTAVLGGLYQKESEENKGAIPYLHKIPVLGYLFKNRSQLDDISELLIFVTPTIVRDTSPGGS